MSSAADLPKDGLADKLVHEKNPGADGVIRYSRDFLLACAKSPLVERPAALPPTSEWFGEVGKEDVDTNRRTPGRSGTSDKIVLGPPKTNFASSSLGGLRRSDEGSNGTKKTGEGLREPRTPRGPPSVLDHGFARETIEKLASHKVPKVTPKDITGLLSGMNSRTASRTTSSSQKLGSGRSMGLGVGNGMNSNNSNNAGNSTLRTQRSDAPEWMTYDPETQSSSRETNGSGSQEFVDDIQAWKARMKEHERREREKEAAAVSASMPSKDRDAHSNKPASRADTSTSWRANTAAAPTVNKAQDASTTESNRSSGTAKPLVSSSMQDIDLLFASGDIDLMKPLDPSSSAFDKFLSQHTLAAAETAAMGLTPRRTDGGSRFARFFDDEPEVPSPMPHQAAPLSFAHAPAPGASVSSPDLIVPGRQLSLDQLFQSHSLGGGSGSGSGSDPAVVATAPRPPAAARMLSEADILASMSGPKPATSRSSETNDEDAFAFSKIMSALSKTPVRQSEDARHAALSPRQETASALPGSGLSAVASSQVQSPVPQDPSIIMVHSKPPTSSGQTVTLDTLKSLSLGGRGQEASSVNVHGGLESAGAAVPPTEGHNDMSVSTAESTPAPSSASTSSGSVSAMDSTTVSSSAPLTAATPPLSAPSASTGATPKAAAKPVHLAFAGGVPTSVYRQLSGKSDKAGSPLARPLSTGPNILNGGGASPSLSSPSLQSPHPSNQGQQSQMGPSPHPHDGLPTSQPPGLNPGQQGSPNVSKAGFAGFGNQPMPHSPGMDSRMYPNMMHPPHYGPGGPNQGQPDGYFHRMPPMQRPHPPFVSQMPPFSQPGTPGGGNERFMSPPPPHPPHPSQLHHPQQGGSNGEFGGAPPPPHPAHGGPHPSHPHPGGPFPNQFVGNMPPPFGGPPPPMHHLPGMMPPPPHMNAVEAMLHRGGPPGGPGMPPGGMGPNHFVPANFGHPMLSPHGSLPMNPPFFPPQGAAKPMMNREEFEHHHVPQ